MSGAGAPRFWANWVVWFLFLFTLALGALFLVALEHLVSARWSVPLRRIPERLASLLIPLCAVALLSLGALRTLYPGTRSEAADPACAGKAIWLGLPFFSARVRALRGPGPRARWPSWSRGSLRQDRSRDPRSRSGPAGSRRCAWPSSPSWSPRPPSTGSAASTPAWYSDVIGVYLFAGRLPGRAGRHAPWPCST